MLKQLFDLKFDLRIFCDVILGYNRIAVLAVVSEYSGAYYLQRVELCWPSDKQACESIPHRHGILPGRGSSHETSQNQARLVQTKG